MDIGSSHHAETSTNFDFTDNTATTGNHLNNCHVIADSDRRTPIHAYTVDYRNTVEDCNVLQRNLNFGHSATFEAVDSACKIDDFIAYQHDLEANPSASAEFLNSNTTMNNLGSFQQDLAAKQLYTVVKSLSTETTFKSFSYPRQGLEVLPSTTVPKNLDILTTTKSSRNSQLEFEDDVSTNAELKIVSKITTTDFKSSQRDLKVELLKNDAEFIENTGLIDGLTSSQDFFDPEHHANREQSRSPFKECLISQDDLDREFSNLTEFKYNTSSTTQDLDADFSKIDESTDSASSIKDDTSSYSYTEEVHSTTADCTSNRNVLEDIFGSRLKLDTNYFTSPSVKDETTVNHRGNSQNCVDAEHSVTFYSKDNQNSLRIYKCSHCIFTSEYKGVFEEHLRLHKNLMTESHYSNKALQAMPLDKPNVGKLKHGLIIKKVDNHFNCSFCNKCFTEESILQLHLKMHKKEKQFKCPVCSKTFTLKGNLKQHLLIHTREKQFKCPCCSECFTSKTNLRQHITIHYIKRKPKSSQCNKYFTKTFDCLTQDIMSHPIENYFQCSHCGKICTAKSKLRHHIRAHVNDKLFTCSQCYKSFKQKVQLERHTMTHTGEKPFKCTYCSKGFSQKGNLRNHTMIHTGEKRFKCNECNYSCIEKGSIRMHVLMHLKENPFECFHCSRGFKHKTALRNHIMARHN